MLEQAPVPRRIRVIDAGDRRILPSLREIWAKRELLYFLTLREVKLKYRQTLLGIAWALLQPLLSTLLLSLVFSRVPGFSTPGVPYPLFCYAGFMVWLFFSSGIARAATSLASQSHVLSKVYFPRLIVPLASVLGGLPDLAVAALGLAVLMAVYRVAPGPALLALPAYLLLALLLTFAVGIWLAALGARYRDVRHAIPFLIQLWMLASPIFYPVALVEHRFNGWLLLNPMTAVLEGERWSLGIGAGPSLTFVLVSAAVTLTLAISGLVYFHHSTRDFVDEG